MVHKITIHIKTIKKNTRKYFLTISVFIITISSYSQASPQDKFGAWYMFDGTLRVLDKLSIKTGIQLRSFEVLDNINLMLYYTGIKYHLSEKTSLTMAYCYLDIDKKFLITGENHLYESRPYEQISYKQKIYNFPINHRLRLEHRFLNYKQQLTTLHKFRYRIGTKINLNKTFFIKVNEEVFMNTKNQVFTENRLFAALGYQLSKSSNIQLGYLNHEINKQNLNRLQVGFFIKTDLRK
ncbi:DUF2490 domain-containing protein [Flavobacteriaceae bacterium]|nr:DUF2490 domain-containing protein [Flavobacteriaceae bacterium]